MGSGVRESVGVGRGDGVGGVRVGSRVGVGCGVLVGGVVAVGTVCARGAGESEGVVSVLAVGWSAQANAAIAVPAAAQRKDIVSSRFIECTLCSSGTTNDTATRCGSKRLVVAGSVSPVVVWLSLWGRQAQDARFSPTRALPRRVGMTARRSGKAAIVLYSATSVGPPTTRMHAPQRRPRAARSASSTSQQARAR